MGLDMYLTAERYLWESGKKNDNKISDAISDTFKDELPEGCKPTNITVKLGYWRKANHIHAWFVKNVQNGVDECQSSDVSTEMLEQLKDACETVLSDNTRGPDLLPTAEGFFFGPTDYDEDYLRDVKETIAIAERALKIDSGQWAINYTSSW